VEKSKQKNIFYPNRSATLISQASRWPLSSTWVAKW